jgi:hypothetical protein
VGQVNRRAAVVLLLVLALGGAGVVLPGAAPDAQGARAAGVVLRLTGVSPAALDADHPLVVRGTIRNTGPRPVKDARLALRMFGAVLGSRAAVDGWVQQGTATSGGYQLPGDVDLKTLPVGATRPFKLTVPKGRTGLTAAGYAFGPRALALEATRAGSELGALRTTVVWSPTPDDAPTTRLSMLAPVTASTTTTDAGAADRSNADLLADGGRLTRVLEAATDPEFDWAVDPAVLQAADRIATGGVRRSADDAAQLADDAGLGSPTPTATDEPAGPVSASDTADRRAAAAWLAGFRDGREDRAVIGLPYADPDLNSLLNSGRSDLLKVADALGASAARQVLGQPLDGTVGWPGDGRVAGLTIAALARQGRSDVILAAGSQPPDPAVASTPTGRSTMRSHGRALHGLLYDEQLSALVNGATGPDGAAGTQTLLAQLAAIGLELPQVRRHVLAVTPRAWDPTPASAAAMVQALRQVSWVDLRDLDDLRTQDVATLKRARPEYGAAAERSQLPGGQLTAIGRLNNGLSLLGPALVEREQVLPPLQERLASLLSYAWRREPETLSAARLEVARIVTPVTGGVRLLTPSQNRLLPGKSASIPVFVQNSTPYPVRVVLQLKPRTGQLRIKGPVTAEVAPGSRGSQVPVPAEALADGDVEVEATMYAPSGQQLGQTQVFRLKVRPDWETRGMVGAAGVLALLLIFGLLRSFLRDRVRVPPEAVPDVDDLASRRADVLGPATGALDRPDPEAPAGSNDPDSSNDKNVQDDAGTDRPSQPIRETR